MRRPLPFALLALAVAPGCGSGDDAPARPLRAVQLSLTSPQDTAKIDGDTVQVTGRVTPAAAQVIVLGRQVAVSGGSFSTGVALDEGANLIDVAAVAEGRRPVTTALRVVREVPVTIPDVEGEDLDTATERLQALGLQVETERGGGLFDDLLPGDTGVCSVDPAAGSEVDPGSTVRLRVARVC